MVTTVAGAGTPFQDLTCLVPVTVACLPLHRQCADAMEQQVFHLHADGRDIVVRIPKPAGTLHPTFPNASSSAFQLAST